MVEADLQKRIIEELRGYGYWPQPIEYKNERGATDLVILRPRLARVLWAEIKLPTGELSEHQRANIIKLKEHGQKVIVVTSVAEALAAAEEYLGRAW